MTHRVTIHHDACPQNPFEDWDCEPPLASLYNKTLTDPHGLVSEALSHVSDWRLARHARAICQALDACPVTLESDITDNIRAYGGTRAAWRRDMLRDIWASSRVSEQMDAAQVCYKLAGIEALNGCSQGYSQGDCVDLLIVATPDWARKTGAPRDTHARQLESARKLWGYWAWGDVWGYVITDSDGEEVDSCWGFYGELGSHDLIDAMTDQAGDEYRDAIRDAMDAPEY